MGVILVQMIAGSHPFLRPNTGAMTFAILNQAPAAVDMTPPAVQPILYRALSKKPETRYLNAEEMLHALEAAHAQITSSPASPEETTLASISTTGLKRYAENASSPRWAGGTPKKTQRLWLGSLGIAAAAAVVFFLPSVRERFAGLAYAGSEKHIAVFPFANTGGDPGWLYMNQKRYAESAEATRNALELNDKDWRVWANLQQAYIWLKDDKKMRPARAKTLTSIDMLLPAKGTLTVLIRQGDEFHYIVFPVERILNGIGGGPIIN